MTPCECGHEQTDDGWCEVVIGKEVHEVAHDGRVCRLCGRDVFVLTSGCNDRSLQ